MRKIGHKSKASRGLWAHAHNCPASESGSVYPGWYHVDRRHGRITVPTCGPDSDPPRAFFQSPVVFSWVRESLESPPGLHLRAWPASHLTFPSADFAAVLSWLYDGLGSYSTVHVSNEHLAPRIPAVRSCSDIFQWCHCPFPLNTLTRFLGSIPVSVSGWARSESDHSFQWIRTPSAVREIGTS